jgi:hypothetical protein
MNSPVKDNSVVPPVNEMDKELVQLRQSFRAAVEAKDQHGLKLEAITAHMRARGCAGMDGSYLHKLYSGERTLTAKHIVALPDTVNALFYSLLAEQHDGQIVIKPATGADGVRQFASGFYGFMVELAKLPPGGKVIATAALRRKRSRTLAAGGHR